MCCGWSTCFFSADFFVQLFVVVLVSNSVQLDVFVVLGGFLGGCLRRFYKVVLFLFLFSTSSLCLGFWLKWVVMRGWTRIMK